MMGSEHATPADEVNLKPRSVRTYNPTLPFLRLRPVVVTAGAVWPSACGIELDFARSVVDQDFSLSSAYRAIRA